MKKDDRENIRRERFVMISTSALVLTALTVTGVYMRSHTRKAQDNGYSIDFSALENRADDKIREISDRSEKENDELIIPKIEVGAGEIIIPGLTDGTVKGKIEGSNEVSSAKETVKGKNQDTEVSETKKNNAAENSKKSSGAGEKAGQAENKSSSNPDQSSSQGMSENAGNIAENAAATNSETLPYVQTSVESPVVSEELHFSASEMQKPVSGAALIDYSMDHSVYFATLDQYKYNPAVIYSAKQGETVTACATGRVINVHSDPELGHVLVLDLGDGYQAIYGQVENIAIPIGARVEAGENLATVAAPTKYFSKEGTNLYFKLEKDGVSIDPGDYF